MPRGPVGRYPTIEFSHDLGTRSWVVGTTFRYSVQPIRVKRPRTGQVAYQITCALCGAVKSLSVSDAATARRRRLLWLTPTMPCGAILIASVMVPTEAMRFPGVIAGVIGALFAIKWWTEDGVSFITKRDGVHSLQFSRKQRK